MKRVLGALGVSLLLACVLVFATAPAPAAADDLIDGATQIIPAAGGTATLTGMCLASGVCEVGAVVAVTVGGAMVVGWGLHAMHAFGWGSSHTVEQATVVSPTTSTQAGGGCWSYLDGVAQTTSPCAKPYDGYGPFGPFGGSNPTTYTSIVVTGAVAHAVTGGNVSATITITLGGSAPPTGRVKAQLACVDGSLASGQDLRSVGTWTASSTFAVPVALAASGCSAHGGANAFRVDDTLGPGCCGTVATYTLPTAAPLYEVPAPDHKWRAVKICHGGGGDTSLTAYSALFKEADSNMPDFPNPACPAGTLATSFTVYEGDAQGANGTQVLHWTAPSSWANPSSVEYSDCLPGGSAAPCTVRLLKFTPFGSYDCTGGHVDCSDFDPSTSSTDQYQCQWGAHVVGLDQCAALKTVTQTVTPPTSTGTPQDVQAPPADSETVPVATNHHQSNGACVGSVTWNPISWVLKPIKCALVWAFVPDDIGHYADNIRAAADGTLITAGSDLVTQVQGAWSGMVGNADSGDCHGPTLNLPVIPGQDPVTVKPLEACSGGVHAVATTTHTILTLGIAVGGAVVLINLLMSVWGGPQINTESIAGSADGQKDGQGRFVL
jgi:hypothetical protein